MTTTHDPRIGDLLGRALGPGAVPRAVLIGFPSDEGVRRNGGCPGAREAPAAIRRALHRLTPDATNPGAFTELITHVADLGDIEVSGDVERDQAALGAAIAPHLALSTFVLVFGGGHETSFGHFLGYVAGGRSVEILNWDAHPDVREGRAHSGSPFRQAVEDASGGCRRYSVAGLQPHATARAHLEFVQRHGRAVMAGDLSSTVVRELYAVLRHPAFVSFDLDAVDQTAAPGVSAPTARGLDPRVWLDAAYRAGLSPAVTSVDIVELCPPLDRDGQTARLAALTAWEVLRGLAQRVR